MEKLIKCPDCNGIGGDLVSEISDYIECPTCDGIGEVEEGTKGWIERVFLYKG